jgi:hypothetical protein
MSSDNRATAQLETIDPKTGEPPKSRLTDASMAWELWGNLKSADRQASYNRARIDAAYDNDKPFADSLFAANGQDYRVNVSWGFAKQVLDTALAGYVDIMNAVQKLFRCPTTYGNPAERFELESVVEEEVSETIRSWRDFFPTYLRLCLNFIKHGVSVALPNDEFDWRFTASDLSDFKIPRETKIGQENVELAACLRYYTPVQLYRMIQDPKIAETLGYNVKAIRKLIITSVRNGFAESGYGGDDNWEKLERQIRNNDIYFSYGSSNAQLIKVVHLWIKEYDGRVSSFMIDGTDQQKKFLYKKVGRFKNCYQAFTLFTYGVGTSGDYHSVRGQGYDVFPIHGALNIAYCQVLELATYGSAPTFQPKDESALQEMQFLPTGAYNLITPGIQVLKDSIAPNIAQNVLPVIQNFAQMFRDRTSQYHTEQLVQSGQDKTKFQLQAELGAIAKMTLAALNLFYDPFESLLRDVVRRMKRRDYQLEEPGGEYIIGLHKRLLQRGAGGMGPSDRYLQAFLHLDVERLVVMRAIGAGSEAARTLAMDRIMGIFGSLPDFGKQAALFDMCAETVGYRNASRYAMPPGQDETPTVDASIAQLENAQLISSGDASAIHVLDGQNNLVHGKTHLEAAQPMIQQAQENPDLLVKVLPGLNALNQHTTEHVEKLSQDPQMKTQSAMMRQAIQQADEIIHNGMMHLRKLDRAKQAEAKKMGGAVGPDGQPMPAGNGAPGQVSAIDPVTDQKIQSEIAHREAKIQTLNRESEVRLAIEQQKATQQMALRDAESAAKIMQRR